MLEKIVEIKQCKSCNIKYNITNKDLKFYDKVNPVFDGKKFNIPTPTLCSTCRQQRRLSFRNERNLYKSKCDATWKNIISMVSPDKLNKVYNSDFWWSDKWEPQDYWMEYDFSKSFFEQYKELFDKVPRPHTYTKNSENCDYTNYMLDWKNNYLSIASSWSEDVHYSSWTTKSNNSMDCLYSENLENCYNCLYSNYLYKCFYCFLCTNSKDCYVSYDLKNCENCFLSSNLVNKKYYFNNKKLNKEEYFKKVKEYNTDNYWEDFKSIIGDAIHKESNNLNAENCSWNDLINCKNCSECFNLVWSQDCKYFWDSALENKDCMDCTWTAGELIYEWLTPIGSYNSMFVDTVLNCSDIFYSNICYNSSNLFWCIWLKNKKYCILNKQYSEQEYNQLVPKIIYSMKQNAEWWEFFPSSISPFWYNETLANEYFPLEKDKILKKWFNYSDYKIPIPNVEKIISASKLPNNITCIPDDILNLAIECEITKKPFRIIKPELDFYRKYWLQIPIYHPGVRHLNRMKLRNPRKLFDRKCDKCSKGINTTYSPDRQESIYCEECYDKEIY